MESLILDLRHAARALLRRPGFTGLSAATLAIGIGVNVIAFAAVNALLSKPLGFPEAARTGWVVVREPGNHYGDMSRGDFDAFARAAAGSSIIETVAAEGRLPVSVRLDGQAEQGWALLVSSHYMSLTARAPSPAACSRRSMPRDPSCLAL